MKESFYSTLINRFEDMENKGIYKQYIPFPNWQMVNEGIATFFMYDFNYIETMKGGYIVMEVVRKATA